MEQPHITRLIVSFDNRLRCHSGGRGTTGAGSIQPDNGKRHRVLGIQRLRGVADDCHEPAR